MSKSAPHCSNNKAIVVCFFLNAKCSAVSGPTSKSTPLSIKYLQDKRNTQNDFDKYNLILIRHIPSYLACSIDPLLAANCNAVKLKDSVEP